jgi:hypothetical protein
MSDQLLNTLKVALLALLYLFFARVLWAVWSEVRVPVAAGIAPKVSGGGKAAPGCAGAVADGGASKHARQCDLTRK